MHPEKLLQRLVRGEVKNVPFVDLVTLVRAFGFQLLRTAGSHHIFGHPGIPEQVNLQNVKGEAKPYQIRQFLRLVEKYNIKLALQDNRG